MKQNIVTTLLIAALLGCSNLVGQFTPPTPDRIVVTTDSQGNLVAPPNFWTVNSAAIYSSIESLITLDADSLVGTIPTTVFAPDAGSNVFLRWTGSAWEWRTAVQVRTDIGADNAGNITAGTLPVARLPATVARTDTSNSWTSAQTFPSAVGVDSGSGVASITYGGSSNVTITLQDSSGTVAYLTDVEDGLPADRILRDSEEEEALNWELRQLLDADGVVSLDWTERELIGSWTIDGNLAGISFSDISGLITATQFAASPSSNAMLRWSGSAWEWRTPANVRADIGANDASNLTTGTIPEARIPGSIARTDDIPDFEGTNSNFRINGDGLLQIIDTGATGGWRTVWFVDGGLQAGELDAN